MCGTPSASLEWAATFSPSAWGGRLLQAHRVVTRRRPHARRFTLLLSLRYNLVRFAPAATRVPPQTGGAAGRVLPADADDGSIPPVAGCAFPCSDPRCGLVALGRVASVPADAQEPPEALRRADAGARAARVDGTTSRPACAHGGDRLDRRGRCGRYGQAAARIGFPRGGTLLRGGDAGAPVTGLGEARGVGHGRDLRAPHGRRLARPVHSLPGWHSNHVRQHAIRKRSRSSARP